VEGDAGQRIGHRELTGSVDMDVRRTPSI